MKEINVKKTFALAAIVALMSAPAFAANTQGGFSGPGAPASQQQAGGFSGPNSSVTTVDAAKRLQDDAPVTLRGNIIQQNSDDDYTFKDSTGTISVDIDRKHWNGVNVTPSDVVEIIGEVDKDKKGVEIDVKQLKKVNP
ncbi:YgiW/YdeI family stress tolerance OB fold protein [Pluralibacter gergoviae]|nr:YgiW/YdeI family stress tolerance OB fold protein [Pluralibacter gergoviae]OUF45661.1 hypothetical protein AZ034_000130 [Pluralibacter gergoviae]OUF48255.1 hypothetical protein AZ044_003464 [Pluralibacter gergoviae]SUB69499.1 Uncharacterized conserved protein [Pluralibacter gergoviae]